jgi:hypothetical protein
LPSFVPLFDDGISAPAEISVLVKILKQAPDQNRTDTSSLEGYGSTIELQARLGTSFYLNRPFFPRENSGVKNNLE